MRLHLRDYHPLRCRFPTDFDFTHTFLLSAPPADDAQHVPQPQTRNPCRVSHGPGLASSGFARHYSRNHGCFLFLWVLRCFTSPRSLHTPYFIQVQVTGHDSSRVSPFGHPRITARLPTPQGLSQAPTSFIGSRCQGIHHVPFNACHTNTQPTPHPQRAPASMSTCATHTPKKLTKHTTKTQNTTNTTHQQPPPTLT